MLQLLLSQVGINVLEYGYKIGLDWLGKFAQAIIEGVGIIGLGIIVFTIVLKCITLPFDIYQRVNMRKQNLVMREMQPELEKLQEQYANDKTTYNQKMMELYKKNGYSMLGACIPSILSLVILIVAFQGFRTYSQFANLAMYEGMSRAYSEEILQYAPEEKEFVSGRNYFILAGEGEAENLAEGKILWSDDRTIDGSSFGQEGVEYKLLQSTDGNGNVIKRVEVSSSAPDKFITYSYLIEEKPVKFTYVVEKEKFLAYIQSKGDEAFYKSVAEGEKNPSKKEVFQSIKEEKTLELQQANAEATQEKIEELAIKWYVVKIGATNAATWYREANDAGFLWVKNVWYADVSYDHPIQPYDKFKKQLSGKVTRTDESQIELVSIFGESQYKELTSELKIEQTTANGYFILIILSIGFMVLSQFISMRSSKESNKYQTLNGQGAKTQKMMLIIMPLIYAVFAFMYSAAFSIYMTMSSVISLVTTLLSNLAIGAIFKKREKKKVVERVSRKYVWQMTEKEKRDKAKEAQKEEKIKARAQRFKRK